MADIRDVAPSSISIIKTLDYQLTAIDLTLVSTDDVSMSELVARVTNGTLLVEGQIIMLNSTDATVNLGSIPGIITNTRRVAAMTFEYDVAVLVGDAATNYGLLLHLSDSMLTTSVTTSIPQPVIDSIINTKLGSVSKRDLLQKLGVESVMVLDGVNGVFNVII